MDSIRGVVATAWSALDRLSAGWPRATLSVTILAVVTISLGGAFEAGALLVVYALIGLIPARIHREQSGKLRRAMSSVDVVVGDKRYVSGSFQEILVLRDSERGPRRAQFSDALAERRVLCKSSKGTWFILSGRCPSRGFVRGEPAIAIEAVTELAVRDTLTEHMELYRTHFGEPDVA